MVFFWVFCFLFSHLDGCHQRSFLQSLACSRRGPAVLHAAHEPVLRRAAPSLGRPLSLCFPRDRPTPCRGGGSLSRRLPSQRLRRAATLEAGAAASERRSPSGGGQQHQQRRRAGLRPSTWRAPRTTSPICWKK